mgnify:CR=1 FL=1
MIKLNIKIKIHEPEHLEQTIRHIKDLNLSEVSELNPEITIEFGYDD